VDDAPVTVAAVNSRIEAELIVGFLRNHDLRAAVVTDDAGGQEPQFALQGGVRVLVAASDEAAARELLAAAEDSDRAAP
jgi:Putative prokaryotic signal transducing protein